MLLPSKIIKQKGLAILSTNCLNLLDKLSQDERVHTYHQIAYILATVQHETDHTFSPVKEIGRGSGHPYGCEDPSTHQSYYGRGYVQLTGKDNYQKFSDILNKDLVNHPELALDPDLSYEIIIKGMTDGLFTGKKLDDYINNIYCDFVNARRIVNLLDQAYTIAHYAKDFDNLFVKVFDNA